MGVMQDPSDDDNGYEARVTVENHNDEQEFEWPLVDDEMSVVAEGGGDNLGQPPHLSEDLVLRFGQYKGQSLGEVTE